MSAPVDCEQLRRECSDALEAHLRDQRMDGLAELAETLRVLGAPYGFHGELMHGARGTGRTTRQVAPNPGARELEKGVE